MYLRAKSHNAMLLDVPGLRLWYIVGAEVRAPAIFVLLYLLLR